MEVDLDHKESLALKNWCFWTVVLEKTLECSLDCKEIKPVNHKGNQSWIFIGMMLQLKLQYFGHLMQRTDSLEKALILGQIEGGGEGEYREWDGWMASPIQWIWVWANSGSGDGQGNLACCSVWGYKELDTTEWLKYTESVGVYASAFRMPCYWKMEAVDSVSRK